MHCSVMTTREPSALPFLLLIYARIASAKHASRQQIVYREQAVAASRAHHGKTTLQQEM